MCIGLSLGGPHEQGFDPAFMGCVEALGPRQSGLASGWVAGLPAGKILEPKIYEKKGRLIVRF
jgi:hypothetical protein